MNKLTVEDFKKMLRNALACITERADEFSKLDAVDVYKRQGLVLMPEAYPD